MASSGYTYIEDSYYFSSDTNLMQLKVIHDYLSNKSYWARGISSKKVEIAIENSINFGIFERIDKVYYQIGFARVVTDYSSFAWICDVFIDNGHQGSGLGFLLIKFVLQNPALKGLRRICLATKDAHDFYEKCGIPRSKNPEYWMEIKNINAYLK